MAYFEGSPSPILKLNNSNACIRRRAINNLYHKCITGLITAQQLLDYPDIIKKLNDAVKLESEGVENLHLRDIIEYIIKFSPLMKSGFNNYNPDIESNKQNGQIYDSSMIDNSKLNVSSTSTIDIDNISNETSQEESVNDIFQFKDWYYGFKFPKIMLNNMDQDILIEFHTLLHTKQESLFQDLSFLFIDWILSDYPPELFLQQTQIINKLISIIINPELYSNIHFNLSIQMLSELFKGISRSLDNYVKYDNYTLITIPNEYDAYKDKVGSLYIYNYPNSNNISDNNGSSYSLSGCSFMISRLLLSYLKVQRTGEICINLLIILYDFISEPFPNELEENKNNNNNNKENNNNNNNENDSVILDYNRYITLIEELSNNISIIDPYLLDNSNKFTPFYISQILYYLFTVCRSLSSFNIDLSKYFINSPIFEKMLKVVSFNSNTVLSPDFNKIIPIIYHLMKFTLSTTTMEGQNSNDNNNNNREEIEIIEKLELGNTGGYEEILSYLNINIINRKLLKDLSECKSHKQYINILHKILYYSKVDLQFSSSWSDMKWYENIKKYITIKPISEKDNKMLVEIYSFLIEIYYNISDEILMDISFDLKNIIIPIIFDLLNIKLPSPSTTSNNNNNNNNYNYSEEYLEKHIQETIIHFQSNYKESYPKDNCYLYQYINKLFHFISLIISDKNRPIIDQIHHTLVLDSKLLYLCNNIIYNNNNEEGIIKNSILLNNNYNSKCCYYYYPIYTNIILLYSNIINYCDKVILDIIQSDVILWSKTAILLSNYCHINDGFQCHELYSNSCDIIYNLMNKNLLHLSEIFTSIDTQFKFINYYITDRNNMIRYKGFKILSEIIKTDYGRVIVIPNKIPIFDNIINKCANNILLYRECIKVKSSCLDVLSSYLTILINNKKDNNNISNEEENEEKIKKFEEMMNNIWFYKVLNDTILSDHLVSPCFYYSLLKFLYKVILLKEENILYLYSLPIWKDLFNILNNSFYDSIWQYGIKTYFPTVNSLPITIFDLFELAHHSTLFNCNSRVSNEKRIIIGYQLTQGYSYIILNKMNNYVNDDYNIISIKAQIMLLKLYMQMTKLKPELIKVYYIQQYDLISNIYSILSNKIIIYYSTINNEYAIELITLCFDILSFIIPSISDISKIINNNNSNILLSIFTYYINKDQPFCIQISLCNFIYTLYSIFHENIVFEVNTNNNEENEEENEENNNITKLNYLTVSLLELWKNLIEDFHKQFNYQVKLTELPIFNVLKKVSKSIQVLSEYNCICKNELFNCCYFDQFILEFKYCLDIIKNSKEIIKFDSIIIQYLILLFQNLQGLFYNYHNNINTIDFKTSFLSLIGINVKILMNFSPIKTYLYLFLINYTSINQYSCEDLLDKPQINILEAIINELRLSLSNINNNNNRILYKLMMNLSLNDRCCNYFIKNNVVTNCLEFVFPKSHTDLPNPQKRNNILMILQNMSFKKECSEKIVDFSNFGFRVRNDLKSKDKDVICIILLILRNIAIHKYNKMKLLKEFKMDLFYELCLYEDYDIISGVSHYLWALCHLYQPAVAVVTSSRIFQLLSDLDKEVNDVGIEGLLCVCSSSSNNSV